MHGIGVPGNERMPPVEVTTLGDEPVGAGRRQPRQLPHVGGSEPDAIRHFGLPTGIVRAAARRLVEQPAGDVRPRDLARILILELVQAAAPAAVRH